MENSRNVSSFSIKLVEGLDQLSCLGYESVYKFDVKGFRKSRFDLSRNRGTVESNPPIYCYRSVTAVELP